MCTSDLPPSHKQFEGKKKKQYTPIHAYRRSRNYLRIKIIIINLLQDIIVSYFNK